MRAFLKRRLVMNTRYSIAGLVAAFKSEEAFRLECVLFALLFPLAFVLSDSRLELIALVMSLFAVLIAELLNSGLEKAIDRISSERHPLSKAVKDLGSAAVFLAIVQLIVVWGLVIMS